MGVKRILNERLTQIDVARAKGMHLKDMADMAEHKRKGGEAEGSEHTHIQMLPVVVQPESGSRASV